MARWRRLAVRSAPAPACDGFEQQRTRCGVAPCEGVRGRPVGPYEEGAAELNRKGGRVLCHHLGGEEAIWLSTEG